MEEPDCCQTSKCRFTQGVKLTLSYLDHQLFGKWAPSTSLEDPSPDCLWPQQKSLSIGCSTEKNKPLTSMAGAFGSISTMNLCLTAQVSRCCMWQGRCSWFANSPKYERWVRWQLALYPFTILRTLDSLEMWSLLENTPCCKQVDNHRRKRWQFAHLPLSIFSC